MTRLDGWRDLAARLFLDDWVRSAHGVQEVCSQTCVGVCVCVGRDHDGNITSPNTQTPLTSGEPQDDSDWLHKPGSGINALQQYGKFFPLDSEDHNGAWGRGEGRVGPATWSLLLCSLAWSQRCAAKNSSFPTTQALHSWCCESPEPLVWDGTCCLRVVFDTKGRVFPLLARKPLCTCPHMLS